MNDHEGGKTSARRISPGTLLLAASDVAVVPMLVLVMLHLVTGDRLWPVAFAANLLQWLLLPAWVIAPLMWWQKQRIRAGLAAVGIVLWVAMYGGLFVPRLSPIRCDDSCMPLRVMSFNSAVMLISEDALVQVVADSQADIVGLTETAPDRVAVIADALGDTYHYTTASGSGVDGIGILSRYPIVEEEYFYLQAERLRHLRVVLDVEGERLTVIVAHPPPPLVNIRGYGHTPEQDAEIRSLAEMAAESQPSLLIGDFNINDRTEDYRTIRRAGFGDSFRRAGWGFGATFPARLARTQDMMPLVRIDYIFYSSAFEARRAWVGDYAGSDHRPVVADLVWDR